MTDLDAIHDPHAPLHEWGSMEIAQYVRNRTWRKQQYVRNRTGRKWWRFW